MAGKERHSQRARPAGDPRPPPNLGSTAAGAIVVTRYELFCFAMIMGLIFA